MISLAQVRRELKEACDVAGIEDFTWTISDEVTREHERNPRRYAQVALGPVPHFEFAEQFRELPYPYRLGLYAHEVGHVLRPGSEDDADRAGMEALGVLIVYDRRWPGKGLQVAVW